MSTGLLAIAGMGAGQARRRVVLASVTDATCWTQAEGAISPSRAEQIERHVSRAPRRAEAGIAA